MKLHQANDRPLRWVLLANAGVSTISALACLLAAESVARTVFAPGVTLFGLSAAEMVFELGILLLAFAGGVALIATRRLLRRGWVWAVIAADVLWVLDSGLLLVLFPEALSPTGFWVVAGCAGLVALFAIDQAIGLAMLYQGRSEITVTRFGDRMTMTAGIATSATPARVWQVMSDQEGYADVADNIGRVEIVEGRGKGMIRQCSDNDGKSWQETCTLWDEGRAFAFRVHTEAEDYPYPIAALSGTWSLAAVEHGRTEIRMDFEIRAKPGLVNRMLFQMMAVPFAKICDRLLRRWVEIMDGKAEGTAASRRTTGHRAAQSAERSSDHGDLPQFTA